jgi:hypothetical protein
MGQTKQTGQEIVARDDVLASDAAVEERPKRSGEYPIGQVTAVPLPRTLAELRELFGEEAACRACIERLRWPRGFRCPHCQRGSEPERSGRGLLRCPHCALVCTPFTATLLEGSVIPLPRWFAALWHVADDAHGTSSVSIERLLGVGEREARAWLARVRPALVHPVRDRLCGLVEVERVAVSTTLRGLLGRRKVVHAVAIAVEVRQGAPGRVRLGRLERDDARNLCAFVRSAVVVGSTVRTARGGGCERLRFSGYGHLVTSSTHEATPRPAKQAARMLLEWLGEAPEIDAELLDYCLDEFAFRFNERQLRAGGRGRLFVRLLANVVRSEPLNAWV